MHGKDFFCLKEVLTNYYRLVGTYSENTITTFAEKSKDQRVSKSSGDYELSGVDRKNGLKYARIS